MNRTDSKIKTQSALRTNLPTVLTSFIGRQREMAEVMRLLATSRLVTLTGAAGCGKTRLALRAAAEVSRPNSDIIHWVELAPLSDGTTCPSSGERGRTTGASAGGWIGLLDALRDEQFLLVLDNCEHLLSACVQLVETYAYASLDFLIKA